MKKTNQLTRRLRSERGEKAHSESWESANEKKGKGKVKETPVEMVSETAKMKKKHNKQKS